MNGLRWIPRPASWASAMALCVFSLIVSLGMGVVIPLLFELMPHAPRLAWLGLLLVWLAPMGLAAAGHRAVHALLDIADLRQVTGGRPPAAASLWAGFVAWATILVVSTLTALVMLVVDPPPVEPDAREAIASFLGFAWVSQSGAAFLHALVWITLAAAVFELERSARTPASGA